MRIDPTASITVFQGHRPQIDPSAFVAANVVIIGRVTIGPNVSIWPGAVLRGDECEISIGAGSNVQDGVIIHGDPGNDVAIGEKVTLGHRAIIHGCTITDGALIGMGATVLDRVVVGRRALVGANSLVTSGKNIPDATVWMGSPARQVRTMEENVAADILKNAEGYLQLVDHYMHG